MTPEGTTQETHINYVYILCFIVVAFNLTTVNISYIIFYISYSGLYIPGNVDTRISLRRLPSIMIVDVDCSLKAT